MPIKNFLDRVPGGLMVVPLLLGVLLNTFFPSALGIGGVTTAAFSSKASLGLLGIFLVCIGSQLNFNLAPTALKKGAILAVNKYIIGISIGLAVGFFATNGTLLGLYPIAIIAAMTNDNGALYSILAGEYGDETDVSAVAVLSLNDGPFFTMVALGVAGYASIPWQAFVSVAFPVVLGMVLGNLDAKMREFLGQSEKFIVVFLSFSMGAGMDLAVIFSAGAPGILLGVMTTIITGFGGYYSLKLFKEEPFCGLCEGSTAGNAVGVPLAIAAADPSFEPIVAAATVQVAASCIVTALLCPALVVFMDKHLRKKGLRA